MANKPNLWDSVMNTILSAETLSGGWEALFKLWISSKFLCSECVIENTLEVLVGGMPVPTNGQSLACSWYMGYCASQLLCN